MDKFSYESGDSSRIHDLDFIFMEETPRYRDLSGITPEDLYHIDDEIKYRALALGAQQPTLMRHQEPYELKNNDRPIFNEVNSFPKSFTVQIESNPASILDSCWGVIPNITTQELSSKPTQIVYLPEKPMHIMNTHVLCNLRLDIIRDRVSSLLDNNNEISFEFNSAVFKWIGTYVKGSKICFFEIQVYLNEQSSEYVIEINRKKGECCLCYCLFRQIKEKLVAQEPECSKPIPTPVTNISDVSLSDKDIHEALLPIIAMAKDTSNGETQLEAAKILYALTCRDETLEQLRESGVTEVLSELVAKGMCDCTRRNAAFALTNMSESPSCQEAIIETGVIPELIKNITNGTYHTCETRRACARLLANLASRMSDQIAQCIGVEKLREWMHSVDSINDSKLRVHADRAKCSLQETVFAL